MSKPFELGGHLHDQSTYMGRLKHFVSMTNPMLGLVSNKTLQEYKGALAKVKAGEKLPAHMNDAYLWNAQKYIQANFHPDTGEKVFVLCRMWAFVPANIPIMYMVVFSPKTPFWLIFGQWINQSYNAGFNYCNAPLSVQSDNATLFKSYLMASGSSAGIAYSLNNMVKYATALGPAAYRFASSLIPYTAVAGANMVNLFVLRRQEMYVGLDVFDDDGTVYGKSQAAGVKAVKQTCLSRAVMPIGPALLPIWGIQIMKALGRMPTSKLGQAIYQGAAIGLGMGVGLSGSVALFPQFGELDVKEMEPQFQNLKDKDGNAITKLHYNKGI
mmetsp:Transcript_22200/g.25018  ORF Transcript_22200/g.25018 Transcript_22200/m.25018 type:complete len:327 (+) Transcript_22200:57-1037(+)